MNTISITQVQQIGTGIAIIIFPLIFVFAFLVHPRLLKPRLLPPAEIIRRARGSKLLELGHGLVLLNTTLLVVTAIHFMEVLSHGSAAWAGFAGGLLGILGAVLLAADKGALCLTMSALDHVSDGEFSAMMPGLLAMFNKKGWMVVLWGMVALPAGFAMQAVGLLQVGALPVWQSILFLIGVLFVATPDGLEIINLSASVFMATALIPYGIRLVAAAI
jgi:hypothetical protein